MGGNAAAVGERALFLRQVIESHGVKRELDVAKTGWTMTLSLSLPLSVSPSPFPRINVPPKPTVRRTTIVQSRDTKKGLI